jgi:hypothetical protein
MGMTYQVDSAGIVLIFIILIIVGRTFTLVTAIIAAAVSSAS